MVAANQGPHSLDYYLRPLMDPFPNLHVGTSYLFVEGLIEGLCERYGPERLLFGTAFPDNCSRRRTLRLAQADIGEEARALIAAGNLERLLAWDVGPAKRQWKWPPPKPTESQCASALPTCSHSEDHGGVPGRRGGATTARSSTCTDIWGPFGSAVRSVCNRKGHAAVAASHGVKHIVCSSTNALLADPEQGNRAMQEIGLPADPEILSGYWAVNPNYPELRHGLRKTCRTAAAL